MTQTLFNLVGNSVGSFWAGCAVVALAVWALRLPDGRAKTFFLSLPIVKIFWDMAARGVPLSSVIRAGVDPLALPPKHQVLSIGAGLTRVGPQLEVAFGSHTPDGREFSTSVPDYLFFWLRHHFGWWAPAVLLSAVIGVAVFRLGRRLWAFARFERHRRARRTEGARVVSGAVDVYVSGAHRGSPFTGGIWRPYVCLPRDTWRGLDREEQAAVIAHELAHVRHHDLAVTLALQAAGDLCWFVPGYRRWERRLERLREVRADRAAVAAGASAPHLASALLKLGGQASAPAPECYSAFLRQPALLRERVGKLLSTAELAPRWPWRYGWARLAISLLILSTVAAATFGGNHL